MLSANGAVVFVSSFDEAGTKGLTMSDSVQNPPLLTLEEVLMLDCEEIVCQIDSTEWFLAVSEG